jgi:hypothetical protein
MDSQDCETEEESEYYHQAVYGAHQSYGPDGNYDNSHYAMSAAAEYQDQIESDDEDEETYAS